MYTNKELANALTILKNECCSHKRCEECPLRCSKAGVNCMLVDIDILLDDAEIRELAERDE